MSIADREQLPAPVASSPPVPETGGRAVAAPRRRFSARHPGVTTAVAVLASVVVFFSAWYLVRAFVLSDSQRFLLPTPLDVWRRGFADGGVRSEIFSAAMGHGEGGDGRPLRSPACSASPSAR